ncbi:MAG TPA: GAF domain-containing protein [Amycolatopsis sp.]|nr:GAF domain-containing protein [Amycolatopsis sp.]
MSTAKAAGGRLGDLARAAARDLAGDAVVVTVRTGAGALSIAATAGIGPARARLLAPAFTALEGRLRSELILRLTRLSDARCEGAETLLAAGFGSVMTARIDNGRERMGALHVLRHQQGLLENAPLVLAYANHCGVAIACRRGRRRLVPVPAWVVDAVRDLPGTAQSSSELVKGLDDALAGVFGSGMCGIMLSDGSGDALQMLPGSFGADERTAASYRIKVSNSRSNAARVFVTGDPYFSNRPDGDPAILQDYTEAFGIYRLLSVPLAVGDRKLGVLHHANQARDYSVTDLWRLEAVISDIGRAVEEAERLFVLGRRLRLERILSDTARAITSAQSVRGTLSTALDALSEVIDASLIALVPASSPPILWHTGYVTPAMEQQLLAQAGERPERRSYVAGPRHAGDPGSAALHLPVGIGTQRVGMLSILRSRAEPFTPAERDALTRLANVAALAWAAEGYHRQRTQQARIEERRRIADDLHEEVAQILFAAQMSLDTTLEMPGLGAEAAANMTRARALVIMADQALRSAIHQLSRPQDATLVRELESLVSKVEQDFELPIHLDIAAAAAQTCTKVRRQVRDAVLTVVREALVNAAKHAGPCRASVRLAMSSRRRLMVSIVDDGIGVNPNGHQAGHGLAYLRRVVRSEGGMLRIRSSPSTGTKLLVTFPQ